MGFFDQPQGAAILKHGILREYHPIFDRKAGSRAPNGRVVHLDAYAGRGAYRDGTPGSPMLVAQTAAALAETRRVEGYYVEADFSLFEELRAALEPFADQFAIHGRIEDHFEDVLGKASDAPLFGFFDPHGIGPPFDLLRRSILDARCPGPRLGPPTELLLTFSLPGLRRNAGKVVSEADYPPFVKARATTTSDMQTWLGGSWWLSIWNSISGDRERSIAEGYAKLLAPPGWGYWLVPVADSIDGNPAYYLIFITRHPDGAWHFNEAVSLARAEHYHHLDKREHTDQGILPGLDIGPLEAQEGTWIAKIRDNVRTLLRVGPIVPWKAIDEIYGSTYGFARQRHLRKALIALKDAGELAEVPRAKELPRATLRPGPRLV